MQSVMPKDSPKPKPVLITSKMSDPVVNKPRPTYLVSGLLKEKGFSILGGKPKQGKSSLTRHLAVCVAKGTPFLGRETKRGEVLIVALEEEDCEVREGLQALGYDKATDAEVHIAEQLFPSVNDSIQALEDYIATHPAIRLVVIDMLSLMLHVDDLNDYAAVQAPLVKVKAMAKKHPHLHILGLTHSKKATTDNVFDSFLGSTALRGSTDANLALSEEAGQRIVTAEVRRGRRIDPTLLESTMTVKDESDLVTGYGLGVPLKEWKEQRTQKSEEKDKASHAATILDFLKGQPGKTAPQEDILIGVGGRRQANIAAVRNLIAQRRIEVTSDKPKTLRLIESELDPLCNAVLGEDIRDDNGSAFQYSEAHDSSTLGVQEEVAA
jgi:hypothetical protein